MDRVEQGLLETQELQPLLRLRYIDGAFFIWTHGKEDLKNLWKDLITPNLRFTYESSENVIS